MNKIDIDKSIIDHWVSLKRENGMDALEYYFDNILPIVSKKFIADSKEKCDVLISLMGFSPETTVLTASALKPKKLIVITGKDTLDNFDLVAGFLIKEKILKFHQISLEEIDVSNLDNMYEVVSGSIFNNEDANVLVDITGGKKIMSASAAQAAWEIDAPLCYIDGDYDPKMRRPVIGSERLEILKNPSREKARLARRDAISAWKMRQFSISKELFTKSRNLNDEHNLEEIAILLCDMFDSLYNFDLPLFETSLNKVSSRVKRKYLLPTVHKYNINNVVDVFIDDPKITKPINRVSVFLSLSKEYSQLKRYDFAALLSYRALEALAVYALKDATNSTFDPSKPDYAKLLTKEIDSVDILEKTYIQLRKKINKKDNAKSLPYKVAFMDAILLLASINPSCLNNIYSKKSIKLVQIISKIRGVSDSRNQSILAHGETSLTENKFNKINELAHGLGKAIMGEELTQVIEKIVPPKLEI